MPDGELFDNLMPNAAAYKYPLTTPLEDAMDWKAILDQDCALRRSRNAEVPQKYFIVAFRSIRSKNADIKELYAADALAYQEAKRSGGLLRYWYGILNEKRECLAMCIWESREQAMAALHLPAHRAAMELGSKMYDAYVLERYWLNLGPDGNPILTQLVSSHHGSMHKKF